MHIAKWSLYAFLTLYSHNKIKISKLHITKMIEMSKLKYKMLVFIQLGTGYLIAILGFFVILSS